MKKELNFFKSSNFRLEDIGLMLSLVSTIVEVLKKPSSGSKLWDHFVRERLDKEETKRLLKLLGKLLILFLSMSSQGALSLESSELEEKELDSAQLRLLDLFRGVE